MKIMFFDSHAHLNFKPFQKDYHRIIERCFENNIWLINAGSQYETSQRAVEIANEYEKGAWAAVGLHPADIEKEVFNYQRYLTLAKNSNKVAAIGETGLDYFHNKKNKDRQKEILLKHLELAQEIKKPIIIHCREAHEDLLKLLASQSSNYKLQGVIHCFTGDHQQAKRYLELGLLLGFTGIITYSSAYDEIIKNLPLEKILIETDCPYLAPAPHRGQRNEPIYVKHIAQKIAEIRNLSLEEVAKQTSDNALNLFQILL